MTKKKKPLTDLQKKLGLPPTIQGRPLPDEYKEAIKALALTGLNRQQIADKLGINWSTVDTYWNESDPKFEELTDKRKKRFIESCWRNIEEAVAFGNEKVLAAREGKEMLKQARKEMLEEGLEPEVVAEIIKALSKFADIPLNHVSTYLGTLYDKQALAQGDPTEITENITRWSDLDD